jgi:hypothetical protein
MLDLQIDISQGDYLVEENCSAFLSKKCIIYATFPDWMLRFLLFVLRFVFDSSAFIFWLIFFRLDPPKKVGLLDADCIGAFLKL